MESEYLLSSIIFMIQSAPYGVSHMQAYMHAWCAGRLQAVHGQEQ